MHPLLQRKFSSYQRTVFFLLALIYALEPCHGQISLSAVNTPYQQDFNSLASTGSSTSLPVGWVLDEVGIGFNAFYTADDGSLSTSNSYSYGTTSNTERAFGELSGVVDATLGASFQNNTGVTLTQLLIQYTGEQWRLGATGVSDQLDFQYSLNATAVDDAGATWINFNALDFVSPVTIGTVGALNGNSTTNQSVESAVIPSLSIANGSTFWIRWLPSDIGGADHGLAVDDFLLTANPATHYTITTASSHLIVTDVFGNSEELDVALVGTTIRLWALGRSYTLNGGPLNAMPYSGTLAGFNIITINAGNGTDTINMGAFPSMPSLFINGGKDDDVINFNGDITFINNASLDADLQDDDANPGIDQVNFASGVNLVLSGIGSAEVKVSRNVSFATSSSIVTSNGALTIEANQQVTPTSGNFQGVALNSSSLIQVTGSGNLVVKGRGGDTGTIQHGVYLSNGDIRGGSSGTTMVTGTGGASVSNTNHGVFLATSTSELTSAGGHLTITGTGGGGTGSQSNIGVYVAAGDVANVASGNITITGTGGPNATFGSNDGVRLITAGSSITAVNGNINITGTAGGTSTSTSNVGVNISTNGVVSTTGTGGITINGSGGMATGVNQYGFSMGTGSSITTTTNGHINISGYGGDNGTGNNAYGFVMTGGTIMAGGTGSVTVYGEGGGGTGSNNFGVNLSSAPATITSSGGFVDVTGQGGGSGSSSNNYGVNLISGSIITAGGNGAVVIDGNGGNASGTGQRGVNISDATITSTNGHVTVTGTGGGTGLSYANNGVTVDIDGIIKAGGIGITTVTGYGGGGTGSPGTNFGVRLSGAAMISSTGGNVDVTGTGGGDSGNGIQNYGVVLLSGGTILAEGTGEVTVVGTGSDASGISQHGVVVNGSGCEITSSGGDVNVVGYGGGSGSSSDHIGVYMPIGEISVTGDGNLEIYGQGGTGAGGVNYGVHVGTISSTITSASGNIFIIGVEGSGANSLGINILSFSTIVTTAASGAIFLQGNSMSIGAAVTAAFGGFMQVLPITPGVQMELGTVGDAVGGPLRLSETELDLLTAGLLSLGSALAGDIQVTSNITRASSTNVLLTSADDIILTGGSIHTSGGTLSVDPGAAPDAFEPLITGTDGTCTTFSLAGPLEINIDGPVADVSHTQLNIIGTVNLSNSSLNITGTYTPSPGESFMILQNDGVDAIFGIFAGLAQGASIPTFLGGNFPATISYTGGTGNDVVITVSNPDYLITSASGLLTITDLAGNSDLAEFTQSGLGIQCNVAGRNYSYNGLAVSGFPFVTTLAGIDSIQINMEDGNDVADIVMGGISFPSLDVNGGIGNDAVYLGGNFNFSSDAHLHVDLQDDDPMPGEDHIWIKNGASIYLHDQGSATLRTSRHVNIGSAAIFTTEDGPITIEANQQVTPTSGNFYGFVMESNSIIECAGDGQLLIKGKGGDTGDNQIGVYLFGGASITGGSTGTLIIEGTGGISTGHHNRGVQIQSGSLITSNGGPVSVYGTGGGTGSGINNHGVYLYDDGNISAGGDGDVLVDGTGGITTGEINAGVFVHLNGSLITSSGGDITIIGQGGGTGISYRNYGVFCETNAMISAGGLGQITVNGVAGLSSGIRNYGVVLSILSTIQSSGGDIDITGLGGGSGSSPLNYGVYLTTSSTILAGGDGHVLINGTGGASSGDNNFGVMVLSGHIYSSGGDIMVNGQGGGSDSANYATGVVVQSTGEIQAGGMGSVTVTGNGGLPTGMRNHGVHVLNAGSFISSMGGPVTVIGQAGGTGTSSYNHGVFVDLGGIITAGDMGLVQVEGVGGFPEGERNDGVIVFQSGSMITSGGGNVNITGQGGGSGTSFRNYGVTLDFGGVITSGGLGTVTIEGTGGQTTGVRNYGVYVLTTNSMITSNGGNILVYGYAGGINTSSNNYGVILESGHISAIGAATITAEGTGGSSAGIANYGLYLAGSFSTITSEQGTITLTGFGGGSLTSSNNHGLVNVGTIHAGGSGDLNLYGTAGTTDGNSNYGILCTGSASLCETSFGQLTMTGIGGGSGPSGSNLGVFLGSGAVVRSGGLGTASIQGTAGNSAGGSNMGVYMEGVSTLVTSLGGDVNVVGTGGGQSGVNPHNYGVNIFNGATVTAGDMGDVYVEGTGGASAGSFNYGVIVFQPGSNISSNGGDIHVVAQGGGVGASAGNLGIQLQQQGLIEAGGMGEVLIEGTGGATSGASNYGILVWQPGSMITSNGGDVELIGLGGGSGASTSNTGVFISDAKVTSGPGAKTILQGTGGSFNGVSNLGVNISGAQAEVSAGGDTLSVTGVEGGGQFGFAINLASTSKISTEVNGGYIVLQGNSMNLLGRVNTDTNTLDIVTIIPYTPGVGMNLGSFADTIGGPLCLSDIELDSVMTHAITFGNPVTGDVLVSDTISRPIHTKTKISSSQYIRFDGGYYDAGASGVFLDAASSPFAVQPLQYGQDVSSFNLELQGDLEIRIDGNVADTLYSRLYANCTFVNLGTTHSLLLTGSYTPLAGDSFVIVVNTGPNPIIGQFAGLPEGTTIPSFLGSMFPAEITYAGGDGNDVVIRLGNPDYFITSSGGLLKITDVAGNGDVLNVSQSGSSIQFQAVGRTFSLNGGIVTGMPCQVLMTGIDSLVIQTEEGNDVIQLNAFGISFPSLTIDGGTGDEVVNFAGDLTFQTDAHLHLNLQDDDPIPGTDRIEIFNNSDLLLSGTGAVDIRVSRDFVMSSGSVLQTQNGNILIESNLQPTPSTGNFFGVYLAGATLQITQSGLLDIEGRGGDGPSAQYGIVLNANADIIGGTIDTVRIKGVGGASAGNNNYGVYLSGAGTSITSNGANMKVDGLGGGINTSAFNYGVFVHNGAQISAGDNGAVEVIGQGSGTSGNGSTGTRLALGSAAITSSGGPVYVTGVGGGSGTSASSYGVELVSTGRIQAGGTGLVMVNGTGANGEGTSNFGVNVNGASTFISSSGGPVTVNGFGGGAANSGSNFGVYIQSGGLITAQGSGHVIVAGTGGTSGGNSNIGVRVQNSGSMITSSDGDVHVTGLGAGTGNGTSHHGIDIFLQGNISAGGNGNLTIDGMAGLTTGSSNYGIRVSGGVVTTTGGTIEMTGTGGGDGPAGSQVGIFMENSGSVIQGSNGDVSMTGVSGMSTGGSNMGILMQSNSLVSTVGGNVIISGSSLATGAGASNHGISMSGASYIEAGGGGDVQVIGTSAISSGGNNNGINLSGSNTRITTADGDIMLTGTNLSSGINNNNFGLQLQTNAYIHGGGTGNVVIHGQGGNSSGQFNDGVRIHANSMVTTDGGHINIQGNGGGSGTSSFSRGVVLLTSSIATGGMGHINIMGLGGTGTGTANHGIALLNSNATVSTSGGPIHLTGVEGASALCVGIYTESNSQITTESNAGDITLVANSMDLDGAIHTDTSGTVTLTSRTANIPIELGPSTNNTGGPLRLADIELDSIFTHHLVIGTDTAGLMTVTSNLTRSDSTFMHLISDADILIASGSVHTQGGNLLLDPGDTPAAVRPPNTGNDVNADTLSFASDLAFEVDGTLADVEHDQLQVIGHIDLSGVDLVITGTYVPVDGDSLVLILNDAVDAILGTFTGLAEGDTLFNFMGSMLFGLVTYEGGDGNDMVIRIASPCLPSFVNDILVSPDTVCEGALVTLTIIGGDLGGADTWQWYSQDCGVMPVDTGLSIEVNPTSTTTYYVRGEGGCALNNSCDEVVVNVNPYPDASISRTFSSPCYYTDNIFQPVAAEIPGATYFWNFGAMAVPSTATGFGPHTVQYTMPGSKSVKLVIHPNAPGASCPDSTTLTFAISNCPAQIIGRVLTTGGDSLANVNVRLFVDANADGIADTTVSVRSVFTPLSGNFAMASLTPGHYVIQQIQPVGWASYDDGDSTPDNDVVPNIDSLDNLIPVTLAPLEIDQLNLFIESPEPGNISGVVFDDFDLDQMPDPGEGLPNVPIRLFADADTNGVADSGTPIDTALTDASGLYMFFDIPTGHYVLVEADPGSWTNVKDFDASNDGDVVPNTNMLNDTLPVTLINGEHDAQNFFIDITGCGKIVTNTLDDGPGSLRAALGCAISGDTITFHPALTGQTIVINSDVLVIDKDVVLLSNLSPNVTISSQINGLFEVEPTFEVEMNQLRIISGLSAGSTGAAIENFGHLILKDSQIIRNPFFGSGEYLIRLHAASTLELRGDTFIEFDE